MFVGRDTAHPETLGSATKKILNNSRVENPNIRDYHILVDGTSSPVVGGGKNSAPPPLRRHLHATERKQPRNNEPLGDIEGCTTTRLPSGLSIGTILNTTFALKARARADSPVRKSITPWMMNWAGVSPGWTLGGGARGGEVLMVFGTSAGCKGTSLRLSSAHNGFVSHFFCQFAVHGVPN